LEIKIETGSVIGPSAGMMFVLEILDRLLDDYYTARGWSNKGLPTTAKLEQLAITGESVFSDGQ